MPFHILLLKFIRRMNSIGNQRKRSKLVLPTPQVSGQKIQFAFSAKSYNFILSSDNELEQIVKFGQSNAPEVDDADAPTSMLLQVLYYFFAKCNASLSSQSLRTMK